MEIKLTLTLYKTEDGEYGCWLSDDIGGSGIEVEEATKETASEEIKPYIEDYFAYLDEEDEED